MEKERNEEGQYVETTTTDEVRMVVVEGGHVVTTQEVADELDISKESARQKLTELYENEQVDRAAETVWWVESPWPTDIPNDEFRSQRNNRQKRAGREAVPTVISHLDEVGPTREPELKEITWKAGGTTPIEDKDTLWDNVKMFLTAEHDVHMGVGQWKYSG